MEAIRSQARTQALADLAAALTALADRLRLQAAASRDFARLTARLTDRAKTIAVQVWDVRTSRWGFTENAARLAEDLRSFAREAEAAAERARVATAAHTATVDILIAQADRIAALGRSGWAGSDAIRAELEPLEATLVAMRSRVAIEGAITTDASTLARQAAALADHALGLKDGGRRAEQAANAIAQALGAFIDDAALISGRMSAASAGLGDIVTQVAAQVAAQVTAGARTGRTDRVTHVRY